MNSKKVIVHRSLELNAVGTPSKSYYYKYKEHDYFYDVWSNLYYGYVGLNIEFSEEYLLPAYSFEQILTTIDEKDILQREAQIQLMI